MIKESDVSVTSWHHFQGNLNYAISIATKSPESLINVGPFYRQFLPVYVYLNRC